MKYRIKPSRSEHKKREKKLYRRAGLDSPRRLYGYRADPIDISTLFEISKLEGPSAVKGKMAKKRRYGKAVWAGFRKAGRLFVRAFKKAGAFFFTVGEFLILRFAKWKEKRKRSREKPNMLPMLSGALCAVLLVGVLSAAAILYKLIFSNYFGSYKKITVPDLIGKSVDSLEGELTDDLYNVNVSYEYSDSAPYGTVIYQYPEGGVGRKIFSGGSLCTLNLTVSRGEKTFLMSDLVGVSLRDALLELKNEGVAVKVVEQFSDSVANGSVISSEPRAGESFWAGQSVILRVSRGKEKEYVRVPSICGLSENSASALVLGAGLLVGEISYSRSSQPAGTVISQSILQGEEVERGTEVSFVVSAGYQFNERIVPSLYGLTLDEARARLAECGLLCGNVYAVSSSEPSGTVVAQSPRASSVILPSTLTVDIYVSS